MMPALAERGVDTREGAIDPFGDRFATKPETAPPGCRAKVRQTQEVKCLWLARPAQSAVRCREPAKLYEAGLVRVKAEAELQMSGPRE